MKSTTQHKTTKVFIDSNVFLRFLTQDDKNKAADCASLFQLIENGAIRPYVSNIVILEIQFVLIKLYKFPKAKVMEDIDTILSLRNLTVIEKTNTKIALEIYTKHNIKYADCLISTQIPKGTRLVSYDEEFAKIKIIIANPTDFL